MSKYIKLEVALERLNQLYHNYEVEEWLKSLPTIEVSYGEWVEDEYGISRCGECGCINNTFYRNYCPNCGAKMEG